MYVYLRDNIVWEFIPEFNHLFPGVPVEERYSKDIVDNLLFLEDVSGVREGYVYDPETGTFSEPPAPAPRPEPEQPEPTPDVTPTIEERVTSLEESNAEMAEALDMILSGVTE